MLQSLIQKISALKKSKRVSNLSAPNLSTQGLTILECLIAMTIASIVLALISPPILLAVATRVQNQKAEQSFELAQLEVDRIRVLLERGDYTNTELPPPIPTTSTFGKDFSAPASGSSGFTTDRTLTTPTKGLAVDVNQDGTYDFVVQTFRDAGVVVSSTDSKLITFQMGVRVYTYSAITGGSTLLTTAAPLGLTSGGGFQNTRPLSVVYTRLTRSDLKESFCKYVQVLNSATPCT